MILKKHCKLILPDSGPINSLWVANRLDLLLALNLPVIIIDAVYDELTSDLAYGKDREVKAFIDRHLGTKIFIENTFIGQVAREKRLSGEFRTNEDIGEQAIIGFMSNQIKRYVENNDPFLLLYEDCDFEKVPKPDMAHMITVAFLRRLEEVGIIDSAESIIHDMVCPRDPSVQARAFRDVPEGTEFEASGGSAFGPR